VDDEAVVLAVDGEQVKVPLSKVVHGKVVLPWVTRNRPRPRMTGNERTAT
jgi:hypothetical protein